MREKNAKKKHANPYPDFKEKVERNILKYHYTYSTIYGSSVTQRNVIGEKHHLSP